MYDCTTSILGPWRDCFERQQSGFSLFFFTFVKFLIHVIQKKKNALSGMIFLFIFSETGLSLDITNLIRLCNYDLLVSIRSQYSISSHRVSTCVHPNFYISSLYSCSKILSRKFYRPFASILSLNHYYGLYTKRALVYCPHLFVLI